MGDALPDDEEMHGTLDIEKVIDDSAREFLKEASIELSYPAVVAKEASAINYSANFEEVKDFNDSEEPDTVLFTENGYSIQE